MSNQAGREFILRALPDLHGLRLLEVGAHDVNGSSRSTLEKQGLLKYVGVDIDPGPGVDEVVSVHGLVQHFGLQTFDVVLSAEMIEHVEEWPDAIRQMAEVTAPGGRIVITTRSRGFPFHAYPHDYWRFEVRDFEEIFAGWNVELLESDPSEPGVFVCARKPMGAWMPNLDRMRLHSMQHDRRVANNKGNRFVSMLYRRGRAALPRRLRSAIIRQFRG